MIFGYLESHETQGICVIFLIFLFRIAFLTRMPAVVITVPYRQGDSTSLIRQTYGTARGRILTVRSTAVAVYGTVDSPRQNDGICVAITAQPTRSSSLFTVIPAVLHT